MATSITPLILGGCLLHQPLRSPPTARLVSVPRAIPLAHTVGQMLQIIGVLKGECDVPQELRPLCQMSPDLRSDAGALSKIDVVLFEASSPIEIVFRGAHLNRNAVASEILAPVSRKRPDLKGIVKQWLRKGVLGMNDEVQQSAARQLEPAMGDVFESADLVRDLLRSVRCSRSDVANGLGRIAVEIADRPIGVHIYNFRYMPDGRTITWPEGFHDEVVAAANAFELPIFDPAQLVRDFGVENALADDFGHYRDAFVPIVGEALLKFAHDVRNGPVPKLAPRELPSVDTTRPSWSTSKKAAVRAARNTAR